MGPSLKTKGELGKLIKAYKSKMKAGDTESCMISLVELRSLLTYIDNENAKENARLNGKKIDGVRVHFIRENIIDKCGKSFEQKNRLSIAIVPTFGFDLNFLGPDCAGAKDYWENATSIKTLKPGDNGEISGLCPPNCGK